MSARFLSVPMQRTLMSLAVATFCSQAAQAQEVAVAADTAPVAASAPAAVTIDEIQELQVSAKREQKSEIAGELAKFGNQVQVVSAQDIADGGYTNFAELAQGLIRGANLGYSPDEGEFTIRLDGGGDRDTLVALDGVPLYDRGPGVEDIWGATLVDPHMIESVEVFRGGQSLYFGSNAGIGLVSIKTKAPDGTRKGEMGFSYGSFNTRELWGNWSFPISADGKHSVMFYGGRTASDNPKLFRDEDLTDNHLAAGGIEDYASSRDNLGMKYLWQIDDSSKLLANLQYMQIDFQDTFPNTTIYGPTRSKLPLFNVAYNKTWSSLLSTDVTASYRKPELINTKFLPEICKVQGGCVKPETPNGAKTPYGAWTGNFVPQTQRGIGYNAIPAGFEELVVTALNRFTFNPSVGLVLGVQSTNYRDASDPRVRIDGKTVSDNALIADLHLTPRFSPGTSLSLAGRVDREKSFGTETVGKFALRQSLTKSTYFRVNGGNSFSLPRTNELYSNTETSVGNPDLKPEKTKTLNYGLGGNFPFGDQQQLSAELGGFRTDISDRIQTTTGITPSTRFNNAAVTEIRGLVADVQYQIGSHWFASASYTKQQAEVKGTNKQIDATPTWFAIAQLRYSTYDDRYHFSVLPRLQGRTIAAAPTAAQQPDLNFGNWFVLNATAQLWTGDNKEHRFQLRGENLLNEQYSNRGLWGNQQYGSAFNRGEYKNTDPQYFYPYEFQAKGRSVFLTYTYSF